MLLPLALVNLNVIVGICIIFG